MYISFPTKTVLKAIENEIKYREKYVNVLTQIMYSYDSEYAQLAKDYNSKSFLSKLFSRRPVHSRDVRDPWSLLEFNQTKYKLEAVSKQIDELDYMRELLSAKSLSAKEILLTYEEARDLRVNLVS